jgi:hypothetical protein
MYISPELEWLRPYMEAISDVFCRSKKIKKITIMRSSTKKRDRAYAELRKTHRSFQIAMRTEYQYISTNPFRIDLKPLSKVDLLCTLAHEIAHLYHWTHSPEHKLLENAISSTFMLQLSETDYIDEETELKERRYE